MDVATEDLISEKTRLKAHVNRVWRLNQILPKGVSQRVADDYHAKLDRLNVLETILKNSGRDEARARDRERKARYRANKDALELRWQAESAERMQRLAEASSHGYSERLRAREAMFQAPSLPVPVKNEPVGRKSRSVFLTDELDRRTSRYMRNAPWHKRQHSSRRYEGFQ